MTPEDLQKIFEVNVFGVVYCLQAAAEKMIAQGTGGKIINAASIAAHAGFAFLGHYSATKFAVRALTQAAAKELADKGITVNAYCPGHRRHGHVGPDRREARPPTSAPARARRSSSTRARSRSAACRRPTTSPAFVSYLAGPDADYMTGQSVMIDGGIVMV